MNAIKAFLLILFAAAQAVALDFSQSTCTVSVARGGRGSGCVYGLVDGKYLISTAGHVTDGNKAAYVEFAPGGEKGYHYPAVVVAQDRQADWAVLSVEAAKFVGWQPTPIPMIQSGEFVAVGSEVYFAGYAANYPLHAGVGKITGGMIGDSVECSNPFIGGESGGPVVALVGGEPRLIGIIVIRVPGRGVGGFTPITAIDEVYQCQLFRRRYEYQPPGDCPDGKCPTPGTPENRLPGFIVPEVPDVELIPPVDAVPEVEPIDDNEETPERTPISDAVQERLDAIAEKIEAIAEQKPAPVAPVVPAEPETINGVQVDDLEAIEKAKAEAAKAAKQAEEIKAKIAEDVRAEAKRLAEKKAQADALLGEFAPKAQQVIERAQTWTGWAKDQGGLLLVIIGLASWGVWYYRKKNADSVLGTAAPTQTDPKSGV